MSPSWFLTLKNTHIFLGINLFLLLLFNVSNMPSKDPAMGSRRIETQMTFPRTTDTLDTNDIYTNATVLWTTDTRIQPFLKKQVRKWFLEQKMHECNCSWKKQIHKCNYSLINRYKNATVPWSTDTRLQLFLDEQIHATNVPCVINTGKQRILEQESHGCNHSLS